MNTPPPFSSSPPPTVNVAVLPYASRGAGRTVRWTVYHTGLAAVVAGLVGVLLYAEWARYDRRNVCTDAPQTDLVVTVQSLRSQVALFKLQHNDRLPGACPLVASGGPVDADPQTFWAQMTQFTDADGHTSATWSMRYFYGPYMQSVAHNRLNGSTTIASKPGRGVGFVYDFAGGAGSGKIWGVDEAGALVQQ